LAATPQTAPGPPRVVRQSGRRAPPDAAVDGYDDMLPVAEQADPPLTTVRQDIEEMGRLMAAMLLRGQGQAGGGGGAGTAEEGDAAYGEADVEDDGACVVLPTELVRRESA
ncbi:substrate-binding domain-containing protein, partial [Streptomyces lasiicapitis]|uniref:substrate-binding domain-containing protein n=1 Tax=Streptomyces lasiicapitis TaxID=1923961 RepID=UPI0036C7A1DB